MTTPAYGCALLAAFSLAVTPLSRAELTPVSDNALGQVTGQGFMNIENIAGQNHEFTRMTLTMDVETRLNIDNVELGQLNGGSDFSATHVALGHIARADGETFNGQTYSAGDAIPFEAHKPYIELANDATGLAGFRMGFAQARGSMSSNTSSFSGNIGLKLKDSTGAVQDAVLYDASSNATNYRATHIGVAGADCTTGTGCAPLNRLQSITVGEDNGSTDGTIGFTDGFFVGFQRDDSVTWQTLDGANSIAVGKGVYINLPTNMTVDMSQLTGPNGVERLRTHQVDMGTKLF
ncbi:hypothetical protein C7H09_00160 [Marinobacter fuscus]|uniref:Porin n=1 Tax=Marinobacter fuscus TaxID=2109942 RepID=A0A2T1KW45_9GAMM|nr:hypothetical protein [Marinobacter fuscus]PSF14304.1 hypothetical protein C7H09_00160 [Marinobacter fuscus]